MYQNKNQNGLSKLGKIFLLSAFLTAHLVILSYDTSVNGKLIAFASLWGVSGFTLYLFGMDD